MHVRIATPSWDEPTGNARTAGRWQALLTGLGHVVSVGEQDDSTTELLIAIHARKSATAVASFRSEFPNRPIVLLLSGTDLYGDLHQDPIMTRSLEAADRLIVLHERGGEDVPPQFRERVRWIPQSVLPPTEIPARPHDHVRVAVVSNLRDVKDPLLTLEALSYLPESSTIHVVHVGQPLDPVLEERARRASQSQPRYTYLGPTSLEDALRHIGSAHVLSLTSKLEGGANVVSEAIVLGTPVICTEIAGSVGMLGPDYEGYYPVGDARALAERLHRAESDPSYYERLSRACAENREQYTPAFEREKWRLLLGEFERD